MPLKYFKNYQRACKNKKKNARRYEFLCIILFEYNKITKMCMRKMIKS